MAEQQNQQEEKPLQTVSLKNLAKEIKIVAASPYRENVNKFPFITLITSDKRAANMYFTVDCAKVVTDTFEVGQMLPDAFILNLGVIKTENKNGEVRYKLYDKSTSNYSNLADLFGNTEETLIAEIKAEFQHSSENSVKAPQQQAQA